jgi:transposase
MANEYWLTDEAWAKIEPSIPMGRRGVKPANNRRVISGVLHVLKYGCRWRDCPAVYGPHTTIYNRFNRWSKAGIWQEMFLRIRALDKVEAFSIDSTTSKAHRCSAGGKGGLKSRRSAAAEGGGRPKSTP